MIRILALLILTASTFYLTWAYRQAKSSFDRRERAIRLGNFDRYCRVLPWKLDCTGAELVSLAIFRAGSFEVFEASQNALCRFVRR
jgi:hypothetical protein